ncbi:MAG: TauD/TfdA family dioxygenase [Prochlorothrix sp.]|nr:TauD/TfdA family dioxygenase [Prochlorothrix sp.]
MITAVSPAFSHSLDAPAALEKHTIEFSALAERLAHPSHLGPWMRNYVEHHGMLYVKDVKLPTQPQTLEDISAEFEQLCRTMGTLVEHNPGKKDYVWPIRAVKSQSSLKTFSEHNEAAPLHTDSQYRAQPEHFVAMWTIQPAQCGGGASDLLDFWQVCQDLEETSSGQALLESLQSNHFPIGVPSIFREPGDRGYIEAPILGGAVPFRYRYDTMQAGLERAEVANETELSQILDRLNEIVHSSPHRQILHLEVGDVLVVDNHRFLHGRTAFSDPDRHLLRIRFD